MISLLPQRCICHGCLPRNQLELIGGYEFKPEIYGSNGCKVVWKIFRSGFVEESFLRNDDVEARNIFFCLFFLSLLLSLLKTNFYHSYFASNCTVSSFFFFLLFSCFSFAFNYFTPLISLTFFFDKSVMSVYACNSKNVKRIKIPINE